MAYWSRIANVFRRGRVMAELDEEMQSHLEEAIEQGRDPEEARRAFGSMLRFREESSDTRLAGWLELVRADMTFAWRQLRKNPGVSLAAVLSLALAMGACVSAFRIIDALLLRPLPVADPQNLFVLAYPYRDGAGMRRTLDSFDYPQFRFLRSAVKSEAELLALSGPSSHGLRFGSDAETERFWQQSVSGATFSSFGLKPALGRLLTPNDDLMPVAHPVAVLSYDYWTRRFGQNPNVIGLRFALGPDLYQIVGVCQRGFTGTDPGVMTDVFVPTAMNAKAIERADWSWLRIWIRLKPGVTPKLVTERLEAAGHAWREERVKAWPPGTPQDRIDNYLNETLYLESASAGISELQTEYRRALEALGALVVLLLLIACGNLANLMTARSTARSREMAVRVSIGASRWRLIQLVMAESVLIALLASVIGGLFACWAAPFIVGHINPPATPARLILPLDGRVLGFAAGLLVLVTILFGIAPAMRVSAIRPMAVLRGGADWRGKGRMMNLLIGAQVALCFLVQLLAALFVTTFDRLSHQPTGFDSGHLLALETVTENNQPSRYWEQVGEHLRAVPGIESVALCGWALMTGNGWSDEISVNGEPRGSEESYFLNVSPGWFETMRIPLLAGRDFRLQDSSPHIALVNRVFARRYFGGQDPVGRTFEMMADNKPARFNIIGYVGDARYLDMREPIRPTVYVPFNSAQTPPDWATFMVRTADAEPLSIASDLRRAVSRARAEFRVVNVRTQTELVEQQTIRERLLANLAVFFASFGLILSGVGLYGVLTYSVLQQRRDISIRMALGAWRGEIIRRVTTNILLMVASGAALGLPAGFVAQHYLRPLLYAVNGSDPMVLIPAALTVIVVAILSALPPVLKAIHLHPAAVLRME